MRSIIIPEQHPMLTYTSRVMPAPFAIVMVKHVFSQRTLPPLLAILDTGADWSTLAPWIRQSARECLCATCDRFECHHLSGLEAAEGCDRMSFSFDGGAHWYRPAGLVECASNDNERWRGLTEGEAEDLIVGRDVLHRLEFSCLGPAKQFTLIDPTLGSNE